jgi:hypothetical protein
MTTTNSNKSLVGIYNLLRITYGIVPMVAGLDKFTNLLTNWEQYLHPGLASMLPFGAHTFMMIVGVIEIIAGIIVLVKPGLGSFIVMTWLTLIAFTLIASGKYFDVAVRDLTMAVGAYSLGQISRLVNAGIIKNYQPD